MYMKVYMFNWTNPEKFGKNLPNFVEMGPYVFRYCEHDMIQTIQSSKILIFREIDYKLVESWNSNGTVTFRQKKKWIFQESMSRGDLEDLVTNINPVVAVSQFFQNFVIIFYNTKISTDWKFFVKNLG